MKILFKNHNRLGDCLMMTAAIRDYKNAFPDHQVMVDTSFPGFWEHNPHLSEFTDPDHQIGIGPHLACQKSNSNGLHFANGYRLSIESKILESIAQGPIKPDLHMSPGEIERGPLISGKYWLITAGSNDDFPSKIWPFYRWQRVVDRFPWIKFVQIGHSAHIHNKLQGPNVVDMVGETDSNIHGLRKLMNLFYFCQGSMGIVSMQMHLAAAFDKPCVVVAGAREPASFESYNTHRYLHNQGSLKCSGVNACWAQGLGKCEKAGNLIGQTPKCIHMITVDDVSRAIESYYIGGALQRNEEDVHEIEVNDHKIFKMVCNAKAFGGGERSPAWIMGRMLEKGYRVQMIPRGSMDIHPSFRKAIPGVEITDRVTSPCDILMMYANDMVWDFLKPEFDPFEHLQAKRKVMALNYRNGKAGERWSDNWDLYLFLNSAARDGFLQKNGGYQKTKVLAPPVDLAPFLNGHKIDYSGPPRFVRHSTQGDNKFHPDTELIVRAVHEIAPEAEFHFMPGPSFLPSMKNVFTYPENSIQVPEFLSKGNIFWYMLPEGYVDSGPRVIMEAMAMGLPVFADPWGGALDRLNDGFMKDWSDLLNYVETPDLWEQSGKINRDIATKTFNPELWIDAIEGQ